MSRANQPACSSIICFCHWFCVLYKTRGKIRFCRWILCLPSSVISFRNGDTTPLCVCVKEGFPRICVLLLSHYSRVLGKESACYIYIHLKHTTLVHPPEYVFVPPDDADLTDVVSKFLAHKLRRCRFLLLLAQRWTSCLHQRTTHNRRPLNAMVSGLPFLRAPKMYVCSRDLHVHL